MKLNLSDVEEDVLRQCLIEGFVNMPTLSVDEKEIAAELYRRLVGE